LWEEKKACKRQWDQSKYPFHRSLLNRATRALRNKESEVTLEDELAVLQVCEGSLRKKTRMLMKRREGIPPLKSNSL
jgi:hypothetical protein